MRRVFEGSCSLPCRFYANSGAGSDRTKSMQASKAMRLCLGKTPEKARRMSGPIRRRDLTLQRIAQFVAHIRQHGFNDARIPRHDITGHHVVMTAGEIADDTARFTNQRFARGEIPPDEANFKETIGTTCESHIGQIQRGGTVAAEIGAFGEQLPIILLM